MIILWFSCDYLVMITWRARDNQEDNNTIKYNVVIGSNNNQKKVLIKNYKLIIMCIYVHVMLVRARVCVYACVRVCSSMYNSHTCHIFHKYLFSILFLTSLRDKWAFRSIVEAPVYNVHCTLYSVQCTVYTIHCTLYAVHCTLYTGKHAHTHTHAHTHAPA